MLPKYWGQGAGLVLLSEIGMRAFAKGYEWLDLSLTSADNPHTVVLAKRMGAQIYKRYRRYRYPIWPQTRRARGRVP